MQHTVYISDVIKAPVEAVWGVLRNFNGLPAYHPGIIASQIENNHPNNAIGCIRRLTLETGFVREKLLMLDDLNHAFGYSIIEGTLPVTHYFAEVRLHRVTASNHTFCEWWADFEVTDGSRETWIEVIGQQVIKVGFQSAASYLKNMDENTTKTRALYAPEKV